MSFGGAWFFDDILDDLLYPKSKLDSIKLGFMSLLVWLVITPLSFFISFILGFFNVNDKRKCDCCGKYKLNNIRSTTKFSWFCEKCSKKYDKLVDEFISNKGVYKNKQKKVSK